MTNVLYRTVTGRQLDPSRLSEREITTLRSVLAIYRQEPEWSRFGAAWVGTYEESGLPPSSSVYRLCQDLEARLGIAQGLVATPDYRDYLADRIEERVGSRYRFCKETGVDPGQLSRVLTHQAHFSAETLERITTALHAAVVIQPDEERDQAMSPDVARDELAVLTR